MNRYAIRHIHVLPAFKFGLVIGAILNILPGIADGVFVRRLIHIVRTFYESMGLALASDPTAANLVKQIQSLDNMGIMLVVWTTLLCVIVGGLVIGIGAALAALIYNGLAAMTGGLEITADTLGVPAGLPAGAGAPRMPAASPLPGVSAPGAAPALQPPMSAEPIDQTVPAPRRAAQQPAAASPAAAGVLPAAPPVAAPVASPAAAAAPYPQPASPAPPAGPSLVHSQNPQYRWSVKAGCTTIGGTTDNDVAIGGLLPRHAEIHLENGLYVLYDQSGGQTWVNDRPVSGPNMLKDGFRVRLGQQELVFHA